MQSELKFLREENKQKKGSTCKLLKILKNYQQTKYQNVQEIDKLKNKNFIKNHNLPNYPVKS